MSHDISKYYYSDERTFVKSAQKSHYYARPDRSKNVNQLVVYNTTGQVKMWGMIRYGYKSPLVLDGRLDTVKYIDILCEHVRPIMQQSPGYKFILDNASPLVSTGSIRHQIIMRLHI